MRFSRAIEATHLWVPMTEIPDQARNWCTIRSRFDSEKNVVTYAESGAWFGFPRFFFDRANRPQIGKYEDKTSKGSPINIRFRSRHYDYQVPVFNEFVAALHGGFKGFLLDADPAFGKTVMLASFIAHVNTTALVVVPKTDLIQQWKERLLEHTDIAESDIGYVRGRQADWKGKKIIVALVHSLGLDYLPEEFFRYPGQVWFDEVHASVPPETFAPVSAIFPAAIRGGASGTPDRHDGLHRVFDHHVVEYRLHGSDPNKLKPVVIFAHYRKSSGHVPGYYNDKQRRGALLSLLAENEDRNQWLAEWIWQVWGSDRQTVVMSERTLQLFMLRVMLEKHYGISTKAIGFYCRSLTTPDGKSHTISDAELEQTRDTKSLILATPGMMRLGTDIRTLSGMVYATPQSDTRQADGRIKRALAGKKQPVIIDPIDMAHQSCLRWAGSRERFYTKQGLLIKRVENHG